ncbi:DUF86 domain-containing protein [Mycoplasmatota bacterium WC30]
MSKDEVLRDSILFRLIQVAENASNLSDKIKGANIQIPWMSIKGFRNRIVHDYGNVDFSVLYGIVGNDIFDLINMFNQLNR